MQTKFNLYAHITGQFYNILKNGDELPWVKPWRDLGFKGANPYNATTGKPYSGINALLLQAAMQEKGYGVPGWLTYRQAEKLGGKLAKSEGRQRSELCVFWNMTSSDVTYGDGSKGQEPRGFLKYFRVFNVEQFEGIKASDLHDPREKSRKLRANAKSDPEFDAFVEATGATIKDGGDTAAYVPSKDHILMPDRSQFDSLDDYAVTLLHELAHWTGHKSRLNRGESKLFGDKPYAFEELVAEMAAAYVAAELGINFNANYSAGYLKSWLKALKSDNRFIIQASSKAAQASRFLMETVAPPAEVTEGADAA